MTTGLIYDNGESIKMAITHETIERDIFCNTIISAIDNGAGVGNCILLEGANVVATLPLSKPSFPAPVAGVITLDVTPIPEDSSATGSASPVDSMEFRESTGIVVFTGDNITGIAGGGDLELSKNPIDPGDTVQLTSFTYTASP